MTEEAEIFTLGALWKKCQPLINTIGHIKCPPPTFLPVLGPHRSSKVNEFYSLPLEVLLSFVHLAKALPSHHLS